VASIIKIRRKVRAGTFIGDDGKEHVKWKKLPGSMLYAYVLDLDNRWKQLPTRKTTMPEAFAWATAHCCCGKCGGRERIVKLRADEQGAARAAEEATRRVEERKTVGDLMKLWIASLTNRDTRNDRSRYQKHLLPKFGGMYLEQITLPVVMTWIDEMRATPEPERLSEGTMRQLFNLLSRFFSWAIERGHTEVNPCRMVPNGKRPSASSRSYERPVVEDDDLMLGIMHQLLSPYREMVFLQNRSGMRPGEVRGLRMSDLGHVDRDGRPVIRVRYSDDGPLKEDKRTKTGPSKPKWSVQTDDFDTVVGPLVAQRRAEGGEGEDYVFGGKLKRQTLKIYAEQAWREVAKALNIPHKQYDAGRHSMATRNLDANPDAMPQVSKALGHHSVTITAEHYDHTVKPRFSDGLRAPLKASKLRSV
jgi:integrase